MGFLSVVWVFFDGFWGFNQYSGIFLGISGYFDMDSGFFVWFFGSEAVLLLYFA